MNGYVITSMLRKTAVPIRAYIKAPKQGPMFLYECSVLVCDSPSSTAFELYVEEGGLAAHIHTAASTILFFEVSFTSNLAISNRGSLVENSARCPGHHDRPLIPSHEELTSLAHTKLLTRRLLVTRFTTPVLGIQHMLCMVEVVRLLYDSQCFP